MSAAIKGIGARSFMLGAMCGVVVAVVVALLVVLFWPWHVEATGQASPVERVLMRAALNRAVAREAPRLTSPLPESDATLLEGLKLFRDNCAGCHGDGAQPSRWGSTSFLPRVPQFGREPPHRPEWEIRWIVTHGIRNTAMGSFASLMTEDQIWKVAVFVSRLSSLPDSVAGQWAMRPPGLTR